MSKISEDLIGRTEFATSEKRRISLLIGRTEFVTSEKFDIKFCRPLKKKTTISFVDVCLTFRLKWLHMHVPHNSTNE